MENVIHEFKIIETEDGFRIEITGDKDAIRQMLHGFGPFDRGPGFWSRVRPNFWDWCDRWNWCDQWFSPERKKEERSHN